MSSAPPAPAPKRLQRVRIEAIATGLGPAVMINLPPVFLGFWLPSIDPKRE